MLVNPFSMHGPLAFGYLLLCKSELHKSRIVLLMPLLQLEAGYDPDSNSHMKVLMAQNKVKAS